MALVLSGSLLGCQSVMANSPDAAQVRFVNTSVDAPAMDLYVGGTGAAYNLGFATFTSYVAVSPGEYKVGATRANTAQTLVTARANLAGTHLYTAVVSDRLGRLQETVYPDAVPAPVPGATAVRVLNEIEGRPVDVYLVPAGGAPGGANLLASGLAHAGDSGYTRLPAGSTYAAVVVPAGAAPTSALPMNGVSLNGEAGTVRTLILCDDPSSTARKGIYAFMLNDADGQ